MTPTKVLKWPAAVGRHEFAAANIKDLRSPLLARYDAAVYRAHRCVVHKVHFVVRIDAVTLAEGTQVSIQIVSDTADAAAAPTLAQHLALVIGAVEDLPEDAAENHDHYLYGLPKR